MCCGAWILGSGEGRGGGERRGWPVRGRGRAVWPSIARVRCGRSRWRRGSGGDCRGGLWAGKCAMKLHGAFSSGNCKLGFRWASDGRTPSSTAAGARRAQPRCAGKTSYCTCTCTAGRDFKPRSPFLAISGTVFFAETEASSRGREECGPRWRKFVEYQTWTTSELPANRPSGCHRERRKPPLEPVLAYNRRPTAELATGPARFTARSAWPRPDDRGRSRFPSGNRRWICSSSDGSCSGWSWGRRQRARDWP